MSSISAKQRSSLKLTASTRLDPKEVLDLVEEVSRQVKGGGASLLTTGAANIGAQLHVERRADNALTLSVTSGKRMLELCTFSARAAGQDGRTRVVVGGLETYKTSQSRLLGLIPIGPKMILGFDPYKRFLQALAAAIRDQDDGAELSIGESAL